MKSFTRGEVSTHAIGMQIIVLIIAGVLTLTSIKIIGWVLLIGMVPLFLYSLTLRQGVLLDPEKHRIKIFKSSLLGKKVKWADANEFPCYKLRAEHKNVTAGSRTVYTFNQKVLWLEIYHQPLRKSVMVTTGDKEGLLKLGKQLERTFGMTRQ